MEPDDIDAEIERCKDYLYWRWDGRYCFSRDKREPRKHMPIRAYNWVMCAALANPTLSPFTVPKSRQMNMTWELSARILHFTLTTPATENLIVNKKASDSKYIISRMWAIYNNQPDWLKEAFPAEINRAEGRIDTGVGSSAIAMPEGEDPLHGYQPYLVWFDEASHMQYFSNRLYSGAMPMAEQVFVTGTSNGLDDFGRLVLDSVDEELEYREVA